MTKTSMTSSSTHDFHHSRENTPSCMAIEEELILAQIIVDHLVKFGQHLHGQRGLVMTRSAARGPQKNSRGLERSREKERLGNRASNPYKSFRTMLLTGSWSHLVSRYHGYVG